MKLDRYIRQISMIGEDGQRIISKAKVLVVGAGGLGCPVISYLASAGVGKLGIVDGDVVEEHNLQRQIIHAGNVGMNKAESAKMFVERLNPDVDVVAYPFNVTPSNVLDLVKEFDIVVSCPDNFAVRFLLNDACKILGKPMVHSAIFGFEGEAMTIVDTPCYRCVYPEAPTESDPAPIMGFTAGFFGCVQTAEAIKLILGMDGILKGRILRADLSTMEFFEIEISTNPNCPVCNGKLKNIYPENYEGRCKIVKLD
jgi:adenylyltransferase/sulfurtransferase